MSHAFAILPRAYVSLFESTPPPFGFNGLGNIVYDRTYARLKPDGHIEKWHNTCERVINGTFHMLKRHCERNHLTFDHYYYEKVAEEMYSSMFQMKWLPPGRGLWAMGSPITEEREIYAALNNCAFVSTSGMINADPFCFLMDASMLGVGCGFDVLGATATSTPLYDPELVKPPALMTYLIPDTREGWVNAVRLLINSYLIPGEPQMVFDYSLVRPAGLPIKCFGGLSSGPAPLRQLLDGDMNSIRSVLRKKIEYTRAKFTGHNCFLGVRDIVDIMNMIGVCVIAGNVRRTAEIAFGEHDDEEFLNLKNYRVNPDRAVFGWSSNNSCFIRYRKDYVADIDYERIAQSIRDNGEPGLAFLDNMRHFGRMVDGKNDKDYRVMGGNPCLEQSLEHMELCCLVEVFPSHCKDQKDFDSILKLAFTYAKIVTLGSTHWPETNKVMIRNRRIGCSLSGIAQFLAKHSVDSLRRWVHHGYKHLKNVDTRLSEQWGIRESIKLTSIKPSGTVSLLAGATPGLHYPEASYYLRRVRLNAMSSLVTRLHELDYHMEPDVVDKSSVVVSIPIYAGDGVRTLDDVSMWEQLELASFLQYWWADNQVSCTVSFTPKEGKQIANALQMYQHRLKGISFLPRDPDAKPAYAQMPYEKISKDEYARLYIRQNKTEMIRTSSNSTGEHDDSYRPEKDTFCTNDTCLL